MTVGGGDHEDDLARLVRGLSESAWALAAFAAALQKDDQRVLLEDRQGRVLGVLGLAAPAVGGWRLNPAAASVAASGGDAYAARLIATLRWAAAAAEGRLDWAEQDLGTKAALGRGSSLAGRVFVRVLAPRLGDLAERLAAAGGVALDVGTGVGWGSRSSGRTMPNVDEDTTQEPLRVSILRHGGHLVASIHTALDDGQLVHFRRLLLEQIGRYRARGVIIDVAAGKARTARRSVAGPAVTWSGGPGRRPSGRR